MRAFAPALLAVFIALTGCRESPNLVGTWESTGVKPTKLEFRDDGTAKLVARVMGQELAANAKYTFEQNRLTITEIKPDTSALGQIPGVGGIGGIGGEVLRNMDLGDLNLQVSWKSPDEILITGDPIAEGNFRRVSP